MTKIVRENIKGLEIDEDDSVEMQTTIRQNGKLIKVVFDVSHTFWADFYKAMVKKPPYQVWVRATEEEKQKDKNAKGHWEKIVGN